MTSHINKTMFVSLLAKRVVRSYNIYNCLNFYYIIPQGGTK